MTSSWKIEKVGKDNQVRTWYAEGEVPTRPKLRALQIILNNCEVATATKVVMIITNRKEIDVGLVQELWVARNNIRGQRSREYILLQSATTNKRQR